MGDEKFKANVAAKKQKMGAAFRLSPALDILSRHYSLAISKRVVFSLPPLEKRTASFLALVTLSLFQLSSTLTCAGKYVKRTAVNGTLDVRWFL